MIQPLSSCVGFQGSWAKVCSYVGLTFSPTQKNWSQRTNPLCFTSGTSELGEKRWAGNLSKTQPISHFPHGRWFLGVSFEVFVSNHQIISIHTTLSYAVSSHHRGDLLCKILRGSGTLLSMKRSTGEDGTDTQLHSFTPETSELNVSLAHPELDVSHPKPRTVAS